MSNVAFIISQTRSGSTMLQRMLGAHPACLTSKGEPYLMLALLNGFRGKCEDETARWAKDASSLFMEELGHKAAFGYAIRGAADDIYGDVLEKANFMNNAMERPEKVLFIDKTPRYSLILPDLMRMYQPESFVFLVRNPLDVLASTLNFDKVDSWRHLYAIEDKFDADAPPVNKLVDVMQAPQEIAKAIRRLGDRALVVRYEDLVHDPVVQLMRVVENLGLPFDRAMLTYDGHAAHLAKYADDNSVGKHTGVVTDYVNTWRKRIGKGDAAAYLKLLGPDVLMTFGYDELIEEFNL